MIEQCNKETITEERLKKLPLGKRLNFHAKIIERLGLEADMDRVYQMSELLGAYIDNDENNTEVIKLVSESVGREDPKLELAASIVIKELGLETKLKIDDHHPKAA